MTNSFFILLLTLFFSLTGYAQPPQGYYDQADQKKNSALKTAMHTIIRNHIYLNFDISARYWWDDYFTMTDWHPNGYYWDMYSNDEYDYYWGGNYQNREHCMPRSWWGTSANYSSYDANGDLHNLFPANQDANNAKSNYPLGVAGTTTYDNGVVKVGYNTYSGDYKGIVFEPADEYKGDFARTYFYMVTCYQDYYQNWRSTGITSMLKNEIYPVWQTWARNMLLEWHRNDPVSQKEIDRNNAVYILQENRNPFIDFPELAEYIWGNKTEELFTVGDKLGDPELISPENGSTVNFGSVLIGQTSLQTLHLKGTGLTSSLTIRILNDTDGEFLLPVSSLDASLINAADGYDLTINYTPRKEGSSQAILYIVGGGLEGSIGITLTGNGVTSTSVIENNNSKTSSNVYAKQGILYFENVPVGSLVEMYSLNGKSCKQFILQDNHIIPEQKGIYIIKINNQVYKVIL